MNEVDGLSEHEYHMANLLDFVSQAQNGFGELDNHKIEKLQCDLSFAQDALNYFQGLLDMKYDYVKADAALLSHYKED